MVRKYASPTQMISRYTTNTVRIELASLDLAVVRRVGSGRAAGGSDLPPVGELAEEHDVLVVPDLRGGPIDLDSDDTPRVGDTRVHDGGLARVAGLGELLLRVVAEQVARGGTVLGLETGVQAFSRTSRRVVVA